MKSTLFHAGRRRSLRGGTLIEVLVSILILSFGLLAIGNMMAYAMQLPKLAGNRAIANSLAIDLAERMRANTTAVSNSKYGTTTYTATIYDGSAAAAGCSYPNCTAETLAALDIAEVSQSANLQLPSGGIAVLNPTSTGGNGFIYVLWKEPKSAGNLGNSGDLCPSLEQTLADSKPRCVMVMFKP